VIVSKKPKPTMVCKTPGRICVRLSFFLEFFVGSRASLPDLGLLLAVLYSYFLRGLFGNYPNMVWTSPEESTANVSIKQVEKPAPHSPQPHPTK